MIDPSGHFSLVEIQEALVAIQTIARIGVPNAIRTGIWAAQRLVSTTLRPFFEYFGKLPISVQPGKTLSLFDRGVRFFITPTAKHPPVANWFSQLFRVMGVRLEQGHIFIQRHWFAGANPWYPRGSAANIGMQRLGNAGFNLMAIPRGLNQALGRNTLGGALGTFGFAVGTVAGITLAIEEVAEIIEALDD